MGKGNPNSSVHFRELFENPSYKVSTYTVTMKYIKDRITLVNFVIAVIKYAELSGPGENGVTFFFP